jgi:hypothetical protein
MFIDQVTYLLARITQIQAVIFVAFLGHPLDITKTACRHAIKMRRTIGQNDVQAHQEFFEINVKIGVYIFVLE